MREVAEDVFCVEGTHVNWVLVRDGADVTVIDGGWRGDARAVEESVRAIGCRPEGVAAMLLTHAHIDHMGAFTHFHERFGTPALMAPAEVGHAATGHLEQAAPLDLIARAWRPRTLAWLASIARAGALRPVRIPHAEAFPAAGALDLPGRPVPVACPGHTSGHSAYLIPSRGVLVTGDALVTGHPLSGIDGPQLLPALFAHSPAQAFGALDALAGQDADVIVPGHGQPWRGPVRDAVTQARHHTPDPAEIRDARTRPAG